MDDELTRKVLNTLQLYVHRSETPRVLADTAWGMRSPGYGEYKIVVDNIDYMLERMPCSREGLIKNVNIIMDLFYTKELVFRLPETKLGGYLMGSPDKLELGSVSKEVSSLLLSQEQIDNITKNTRKIMERTYGIVSFPVNDKKSIDDIFVISVLWGENWHLGLHCNLNNDMKRIGMEPLY